MYTLPKEIEDLIKGIEDIDSEKPKGWRDILTDYEDRKYIVSALRETYKIWSI